MRHFILISAVLAGAQVTAQPTKVHVKRIENINGVERQWDTVYTADSMASIQIGDQKIKTWVFGDKDSEDLKLSLFTDSEKKAYRFYFNDSTNQKKVFRIIKSEELSDGGVSKEINEEQLAEATPFSSEAEVLIMEPRSATGSKSRKVVIMRSVKITDAESSEASRLPAGVGSAPLGVKELNCYPNPGSGKFNVSFILPGAEKVMLEVFSHDGRKLQEEAIKGVHGSFSKEVDLTGNAKGMYMLRISHNGENLVKKLIIE